MTTTARADVTGNAALAARARVLAEQAGLHRRAWLCVSVALDETRTVEDARKVLDDVQVAGVRQLATELFDLLVRGKV
jgi:hypothetical protein